MLIWQQRNVGQRIIAGYITLIFDALDNYANPNCIPV
jgi:hypothetical protein